MLQTQSIQQVLVREDYRYHLINLNEVSFFEYSGRQMSICYYGKKMRLQGQFSDLEAKLDKKKFFRASPKVIVNLEKIKEVYPFGVRQIKLVVGECAEHVVCSPEQTTEFVNRLSL